MKFQIWCDCNSLFHIDFSRVQEKEKLTCPNCDKEYSQKLLDKLKTVSSTLESCSSDTSETDNVTVSINGYLFTR